MALNLKDTLNIFNKANKLHLTLSTRLTLVGRIISMLEEEERFEDCAHYLKEKKKLLKMKKEGKRLYYARDEMSDLIRNHIEKQI